MYQTQEAKDKALQDAREAARKAQEAVSQIENTSVARPPAGYTVVMSRMAEILHGHLCRDNHTDGCGWFYEVDWTGWTKTNYLRKAKAITDLGYTPEAVELLFKTIRETR